MSGLRLENLVRDRYDREARLKPALLAALPAALCIVAWVPALQTLAAGVVTVLTFFGATVWIAHFARDRGTQLQPRLYARWGGIPSTAMLRHSDSTLPAPLKARYHAFLGKSVPDITMPTAAIEAANPEGADQVYDAAVAWLLMKTRDHKRFPLLFEENISYGFRRNFFGLKPFALVIAVLAVLSGSSAASLQWYTQHSMASPAAWAAVAFALLYAIACAGTVTREWVHRAALAYARQLLACCDLLAHVQPSSVASKRPRASRKSASE